MHLNMPQIPYFKKDQLKHCLELRYRQHYNMIPQNVKIHLVKLKNTSSLSLTCWTNVINIIVCMLIYLSISIHFIFSQHTKPCMQYPWQRLLPKRYKHKTLGRHSSKSFISLTSGSNFHNWFLVNLLFLLGFPKCQYQDLWGREKRPL